jgi:hypothetical protein
MAPSKKRHHRGRDKASGRERHQRRLHRSPSRGSASPTERSGLFQYDPLNPKLDSIRLLELEPVDNQQMLSCRLIHVPFRDTPVYEALSYTWGSPELTNTILLNETPFAIRQNLHDALLGLRKEHEPRVLWADAICIDQNNLEERKRQVRLMDAVYTRAATVLIWLGGADRRIQTAFKSGLISLEGNEKKTYCSWVCGHSYWTRLWIIQEVTLSQDLRVCIGRHSEKWETFLKSLSQHVETLDKHKKLRRQMRVINNLDQKRRGRLNDESRLEKLLEDFQYAECQEPRDKIYGLLGLAYDCQDRIIKPDYTKSTFDLYTEVLQKFKQTHPVLKGRSTTAFDRSMRAVYFSQLVSSILEYPVYPPTDTGIHILVVAAVAGEILEVGPTHIEYLDDVIKLKRWKYRHQAHYPYPEAHSKVRAASAAYDYFLYRNSHWLATKIFSINPDRMYSQVKPQTQPTPAPAREPSTQSVHQKGSLGTRRISEVRWDSNEAHWLSKNVDYITNFYDASDRRTHSHRSKDDARSHRSFLSTLFSSSPPHSKALPPEQPSETSSSPRLFLGNNFLLGSAPSNAKKGDVICQFWNTEVTALLRRREDSSSSYQIVGKVHLSTGYMEGLQPVLGERIEPKDRAKTVLIEMDLRTLSRLTC